MRADVLERARRVATVEIAEAMVEDAERRAIHPGVYSERFRCWLWQSYGLQPRHLARMAATEQRRLTEEYARSLGLVAAGWQRRPRWQSAVLWAVLAATWCCLAFGCSVQAACALAVIGVGAVALFTRRCR